ncbi:hypothetical protein BDR07DRAFT_1493296 [Suillus spraguei]|nr:hypothetical protein BDR07DRAFT_1493296 [Suillus spraguei]
MSDNPLVCQLPGCEDAPPLANFAAARRHRHRYHGVPVPFDYEGCQYIVAHSNNRYTCPLPDCGKLFKQRDSIEVHIISDHGIAADIKIFATPPIGNAVVHVPVPAASSTQGVRVLGESNGSLLSSKRALTGNAFVPLYSHRAAADSDRVASSDLEAFLHFCSKSNVHAKPEQVKLPVPGGPPVQFLADPVKGVACTASPECTYCVKDEETMQKHGRKKHAASVLGEVQYRPCLIQRLFTGVGNAYFEIGQNAVSAIKPDLKAALQTKFLAARDVPLVIPPNTERERTPLRRAADQIKNKHSPEEHGGLLTRLAAAIKDHMAKASSILDGHPHKLTSQKSFLYVMPLPLRPAEKKTASLIEDFLHPWIRAKRRGFLGPEIAGRGITNAEGHLAALIWARKRHLYKNVE